MGSAFNKGSQQTGQASGLANQQGAIASGLFNETTPLRQMGITRLADFMGTGTLPTPLTMTPGLQNNAMQGQSEKQALLDTGVKGGQLRQAMVNSQIQRMLGRDAMLGDMRTQLFNTALGVGQGQAPIAMQGLGSAAGNLSQLGAQRMQQNQAFQGGLGKLVGAGGTAAMMCWIAVRLYGPTDERTRTLRLWFLFVRPQWWVTKLYRRYGPRIAQSSWCEWLRPVMDHLYRTAKREVPTWV